MKTITEQRAFEMHNPPHPGRVFRHLYLEALGLTVGGAAQRLGVTRKTLSELINGHIGISPVMALRIGKATGTSPESWAEMQAYYDLCAARRTSKPRNVKQLAA